MKKALCIVFAALLAALACACSGSPEIIDIGTNTAVPTQEAMLSDEPAMTEEATEFPSESPSDEPSAEPTAVPGPTAEPGLPAGQVLYLNTMPLDLCGVSEADAEAWFADAVFVGDSIMLGWKNYNNSMLASNPAFFGPTHFLCEGSYGAGHALEPVSDSSLHPLYQGQQRLLWDSIKMMGAKKVFICFGLNDVAIYGVEGTAENFRTLCDNIRKESPDAQIYLISAMYLIDDSNMKSLTNENLRKLNGLLRGLCDEKGYSFVDIASHLVGPDGYLKAEFCSDNYVHQTTAAYKVWAEILRAVAARDITK